ncbi:hypothetical protein GGQ87_001856 [Brevundimonas alba]|uniref:Uncharacterized protein n=1 Tax=Brevundimonas alba TaxID=74314 RepID=A0A7X5YKH9_9CAUL|nr:hypothetical protein [Brevundimonas alba]NJC41598.1 hypothetical protein [Brevundimonas alba]
MKSAPGWAGGGVWLALEGAVWPWAASSRAAAETPMIMGGLSRLSPRTARP